MSLSYRVDPELSFVVTEGVGTLTDDDLIRHAESLRSDASLCAHDELVDLSRVENVEVTTEGLRRLASIVARLNAGRRAYRLAVVAPDDVLYGLSRMYEVFRGQLAGVMQTFRSVEEASVWLTTGRLHGSDATPD